MKHPTLAKSFLVLALLCAFSTQAIASEVIGNLSSGGGSGTDQTQQKNTGVPSTSSPSSEPSDNGSIAGNVSEGTAKDGSESGGGGSSGGEVLGEKTMATSPSTAPTSVNPNIGLSQNSDADTDRMIFQPLLPEEPQSASVLGAFSQISPASWFWIIALSVLLIAVLAYIYKNEKELTARTKLRY